MKESIETKFLPIMKTKTFLSQKEMMQMSISVHGIELLIHKLSMVHNSEFFLYMKESIKTKFFPNMKTKTFFSPIAGVFLSLINQSDIID